MAAGAAALVLGFTELTAPDPPWPILFLMTGAWAVAVGIGSTYSDRKLAIQAGREDAPWSGNRARWAQWHAQTRPITLPTDIALRAIANVGGRRPEFVNASTAVGWIGSSFPYLREYQLAVVLSRGLEGETLFTCCARPRFKEGFQTMGGFRSQRLGSRRPLARERIPSKLQQHRLQWNGCSRGGLDRDCCSADCRDTEVAAQSMVDQPVIDAATGWTAVGPTPRQV
jgi:hypothetical protein